jgi:hypothetical protein
MERARISAEVESHLWTHYDREITVKRTSQPRAPESLLLHYVPSKQQRKRQDGSEETDGKEGARSGHHSGTVNGTGAQDLQSGFKMTSQGVIH